MTVDFAMKADPGFCRAGHKRQLAIFIASRIRDALTRRFINSIALRAYPVQIRMAYKYSRYSSRLGTKIFHNRAYVQSLASLPVFASINQQVPLQMKESRTILR